MTEEIKQTTTQPTGIHAQPEHEKHAYTHKKIGDILDEVDDMLSRRREQISTKATEKVHHMLDELKSIYTDLKGMDEAPQNVTPDALKHKQNQLNGIENKAVQGLYGAEAKICPLDEHGQPVHHVRVEAIPPGQATVRDMIEKCHQLVVRVMDRLEEGLSGAEHATSTATTTTTIHTGIPTGTGTATTRQGQVQGHIQTHTTGVTLTEGQGQTQGHKQQGTGTGTHGTGYGATGHTATGVTEHDKSTHTQHDTSSAVVPQGQGQGYSSH